MNSHELYQLYEINKSTEHFIKYNIIHMQCIVVLYFIINFCKIYAIISIILYKVNEIIFKEFFKNMLQYLII